MAITRERLAAAGASEYAWTTASLAITTAAMWNGQPDLDLDHDGRLESVRLDFDHDGMRDDAMADFDGDGVVDHAVLDLDNDGTPEAYFTDDGRGPGR